MDVNSLREVSGMPNRQDPRMGYQGVSRKPDPFSQLLPYADLFGRMPSPRWQDSQVTPPAVHKEAAEDHRTSTPKIPGVWGVRRSDFKAALSPASVWTGLQNRRDNHRPQRIYVTNDRGQLDLWPSPLWISGSRQLFLRCWIREQETSQ